MKEEGHKTVSQTAMPLDTKHVGTLRDRTTNGWSGTLRRDAYSEYVVWTCPHRHGDWRAARKCAVAEAERRAKAV